jgi:hypothetical protein
MGVADDLEGEADARKENTRESKGRSSPRQVSVHASRRVRPRGDPSHPRGEARRPLDQASDRHRSVQGAASRCSSRYAQARPGFGRDPQTGEARRTTWPASTETITQTGTRGFESLASRKPESGIEKSVGTPGTRERAAPGPESAIDRRAKSGEHTRSATIGQGESPAPPLHSLRSSIFGSRSSSRMSRAPSSRSSETSSEATRRRIAGINGKST